MSRPLSLLIVVATVAAAPLPALAQTWPSTTTAAAPQMRTQPRAPSVTLQRPVSLERPALRLGRDPNASLNLTASEPDESLDVELRPKAEWSDDQGLRVGATRIGYKSRF